MKLLFQSLYSLLLFTALACNHNGRTPSMDTEDQLDDQQWSQETDFKDKVSAFEDENRDIWQKPDRVMDILGPLNDKTVVDLGAGTGYFAFRLVPKAKKVIAIDIDEDFVNFMEKKRKLLPAELQEKFEARLAQPNDPHLAKNEADALLIVNTYAYLQNRVEYFTDLRKVLKPNSKIVVIEFKMKNIPNGPPDEEKVGISTVEEELSAAGFRDIDVDDQTLDYQYIVTARS
jgi:ubiquinone/menaquinone biosynthesis C-methylase UbiE